jgi:hypothetical protein
MANNGIWVSLNPEQEAAEKALKDKAETAMKQIVEDFKKKYVQAPHPDFGYISDFSYKWSRDSLYLNQTYKYDSPKAIMKENIVKMARIDFYIDNTCGLSYMRHTGKWALICSGESIETCIDLIKNHPIFHG